MNYSGYDLRGTPSGACPRPQKPRSPRKLRFRGRGRGHDLPRVRLPGSDVV
jgi:hypothetical protein